MTHEQWIKLTPTQQNVEVAKALGAKLCSLHHMYACCGRGMPDYTADLNAMHEAEKSLNTLSQFHQYTNNLCRVCHGWFGETGSRESGAICATAAQRAEAFVLTMTKGN